MISENVIVKNKIGFHARPAALIVKAASRFQSAISISKGEKTASAMSMMRLLTLCVKMNDEVTISAQGIDEREAVKTLVDLVNSKFGEE